MNRRGRPILINRIFASETLGEATILKYDDNLLLPRRLEAQQVQEDHLFPILVSFRCSWKDFWDRISTTNSQETKVFKDEALNREKMTGSRVFVKQVRFNQIV